MAGTDDPQGSTVTHARQVTFTTRLVGILATLLAVVWLGLAARIYAVTNVDRCGGGLGLIGAGYEDVMGFFCGGPWRAA